MNWAVLYWTLLSWFTPIFATYAYFGIKAEIRRRRAFQAHAEAILGSFATATNIRPSLNNIDADVIVAPRRITVSGPPGARIAALLSILLPRRVMARFVDQIVGDMREECYAALMGGNRVQYWAAWIRGHVAIVFTLAVWLWCAVGKHMVELWKAVT